MANSCWSSRARVCNRDAFSTLGSHLVNSCSKQQQPPPPPQQHTTHITQQHQHHQQQHHHHQHHQQSTASTASVAPAMPCKIMKKTCGSGGSNKIKTRLACILEADESTRERMGESLPNHHEDHIAGKGDNSLQHFNLVHKYILMPQAMKIPAAKAAVDKEWEKLEKISAWNLTKVRSEKEVIDEARTKGAKVHFASLMDICHLKNAELETKHKKYKGRVVLQGDIVNDDSGSYAIFTEQGSSASQMTAAKVMDITSRLPGCAGQAADAVSAYTQVKMEDAPKLLKIPKSECPDIWIRLPRHKWPVQYGRPSRSS